MPNRRKIGYCKFGRSVLLDPERWGEVGGDNEPLYLLLRLAERHPDVDWVLVGRYGNADTARLPPNIILPDLPKMPARVREPKEGRSTKRFALDAWKELYEAVRPYYLELDELILWAGQHGTSNIPIPSVKDRTVLTDPQDAFQAYCGAIAAGVNEWRDLRDGEGPEEIWLCADPRNYLKARDFKWPLRGSIMAQFDWLRKCTHERYGDQRSPAEAGWSGKWGPIGGTWISPQRYTYDALELVGIPTDWCQKDLPSYEDRVPFGLIMNENRSYVALNRKDILKAWVLPLEPDFLIGKWSDKSIQELGIEMPTTVHHNKLQHTMACSRSTFTTPASGSRWATSKPHESFRCGVVCFFHPEYDKQGHIIPTLDAVKSGQLDGEPWLRELTQWLRVESPDQLRERVQVVGEDKDTWRWLANAQFELEHRFIADDRAVRTLEDRLGL